MASDEPQMEAVPSQDEAEEWVDATVGEEYASWRRFEARRRYIEPVEQRNRERQREAATRERERREQAELEREAKRAQRKAFGRSIAKQIDPQGRYRLLALPDGRCWAFSNRRTLAGATLALDEAGLPSAVLGADHVKFNPRTVPGRETLEVDRGIEGMWLTKATAGLTLLGVDPEPKVFGRLIEADRSKREARKAATAERAAATSERRRSKARWGVELDPDDLGLDDDEDADTTPIADV